MFTLDNLNKEQREAAEYINDPLLVIAGAGTGKTAMLINRAAYMIQQGICPQNILMLTFTNKAANEMKRRIEDIIGTDSNGESVANRITACTFHSFCAMILRKHGFRIGLAPNFAIITPNEEADAIALVKSAYPSEEYKGKGFPPNSSVVSIISASVNKNEKISDVMEGTKYENFLPAVIKIAMDYDVYKRENQLVSYDDLLLCMNQLLNDFPDICAQIADTYQYIMVDEYQDTNKRQEEMLLHLYRYTRNIAVVGDDMQSLYGFRGAEVRNILDFPDKFDGCKTIFLTQNYRSVQPILDVANVISSHATEGYPKKLYSSFESDAFPEVIRPVDQVEEAQSILKVISDTRKNGVQYKDICVLIRSSSYSAVLEQKLNLSRIPYVKYGGQRFFDLSYVQDVLSLLKIMVNPYDELAWFRGLKILRGIGNVFARRIASRCKAEGIAHLLSMKYKKKEYHSKLVALHQQIMSLQEKSLKVIVSGMIRYYVASTKENIETMNTDEARRTMLLTQLVKIELELQALVDLADSYDSLSAYLDDILLDRKSDDDEENNDALVISTIHSAKGLEFDTVIIMDCIDQVFPRTGRDQIGSPIDNEELRCFYVAITRAKKTLYIMAPINVRTQRGWIVAELSHFMDGTEDLVETDDDKGESSSVSMRPRLSSWDRTTERYRPTNLWC